MQVTALILNNQKIGVFPTNIEKFYANLQYIQCRACVLAEITIVVLDGLSCLKVLDLFNNNIQVIGRNLFQNNPLIQTLHFGGNPIQHIAHDVFDILPGFTFKQQNETLQVRSSTIIETIFSTLFSDFLSIAHRLHK